MKKSFLTVAVITGLTFSAKAQKVNSLSTENLKSKNEFYRENLNLGGVVVEGSAKSAKAVYAEIGGPGLASLNYDMRFKKEEGGLGFRVGIGGFSLGDDGFGSKTSALFLPVGVNYLIGKDQKNYFEVGAGFTYVNIKDTYNNTHDNFSSSFGNLTLGYRLAPAKGGFFFKAEITPVFGNGFFIPYYGGIAFGYKF